MSEKKYLNSFGNEIITRSDGQDYTNKDFVLKKLNESSVGNFSGASEELRNDPEVIEAALDYPGNASHIGAETLERFEILSLLKKNKGEIERTFEEYRKEYNPNGMDKWEALLERKLGEIDGGLRETYIYELNSEEFVPEDESPAFQALRQKLSTMKIDGTSINFIRHLGRGVYGSAYLCRIKGIRGLFVGKIFNVDASEEKLHDLVSRDALYIPYHKNIASIVSHRGDILINLSLSLPDYKERWERKYPRGMVFRTGIIFMKYHQVCLREMFVRDRFYEHEIIKIMNSVVSGLCHFHSNYFVHRDLHTENIFVDTQKGRVWIGDFGCGLDLRKNENETGNKFKVHKDNKLMFSYYSGSTDEFKIGGNSKITAPEIIDFNYNNDTYFNYEKSDLYSVGKIGEILVTKRTTYGFWKMDNLADRVFSKVHSFIRKLLIRDPEYRINFNDSEKEISGVYDFYVKELENLARKK